MHDSIAAKHHPLKPPLSPRGSLAAHMLAGEPIANFVVPTLIPVLAWLGVYLIDERLRALLPVRR